MNQMNWRVSFLVELRKDTNNSNNKIEILDLCREGSYKMYRLENELNQPNQSDADMQFLEAVRQMQKTISDFNQYVPVFLMLLDDVFYFKEEYQHKLMQEVYWSKNQKIEFEKLTFEQLIKDHILVHTKFIYILYNQSKTENRVRIDINRLEEMITNNQPKLSACKMGDYQNFYVNNSGKLMTAFDDILVEIQNTQYLLASISNSAYQKKIEFLQAFVQNLQEYFSALLTAQDTLIEIVPFFTSSLKYFTKLTEPQNK